MDFDRSLAQVLGRSDVVRNPSRVRMIEDSIAYKEAVTSACGALATWTPTESTGRSPKDTLCVRRPESEATIDWDSPNNIPIDEETFDMILEDAFALLSGKKRVYEVDRVVGADAAYALPVKLVTDHALTALFADNMFRPVPEDLSKSVFADRPFRLLVVPYDKLDAGRYEGRLRTDPRLGHVSTMVIGMDFDRRIGVVYGSAYGGSVKKLMFSVMNYLLPAEGILPLHCSANEGERGDIALLLGLSGTGKTTLSADARRALLGDDEHGWSERGIANFENGCYAKLIDLDPTKEPEIHHAIMHADDVDAHGAIVENAMVYPDGTFDLVLSTMVLHEMSPEVRAGVMAEAKRVVHPEGRLLLIDFHGGPVRGLKGWYSKGLTTFFEVMAGPRHFLNYRNFLARGCLPGLIAEHGLVTESERIVGGGNFGVFVARLP